MYNILYWCLLCFRHDCSATYHRPGDTIYQCISVCFICMFLFVLGVTVKVHIVDLEIHYISVFLFVLFVCFCLF